MTFEEWWMTWWDNNAIVATDREGVWKANAKAAYGAGYLACLDDKAREE